MFETSSLLLIVARMGEELGAEQKLSQSPLGWRREIRGKKAKLSYVYGASHIELDKPEGAAAHGITSGDGWIFNIVTNWQKRVMI